METNYISRQEHEEFTRRIDAEDIRQNRRISLLEENFQRLNALTVAVEKMAVNMENMLTEQKRQGERLEKLEREPAETHRQVKNAILTAAIGAIVGALIAAVLTIL